MMTAGLVVIVNMMAVKILIVLILVEDPVTFILMLISGEAGGYDSRYDSNTGAEPGVVLEMEVEECEGDDFENRSVQIILMERTAMMVIL